MRKSIRGKTQKCRLCGLVPSDPISLRPNGAVCKSCIKDVESMVARTDNDISRLESIISAWETGRVVAAVLGFFVFLVFFDFRIAAILAICSYAFITSQVVKNPISQKEATIKKLLTQRRATVRRLSDLYSAYWPLPPDWFSRREQVISRDGHRCSECNRRMFRSKVPFHIHHVVPKKHPDGHHGLDNLALLCEICHSKKPDHDLVKNARRTRLTENRKKP